MEYAHCNTWNVWLKTVHETRTTETMVKKDETIKKFQQQCTMKLHGIQQSSIVFTHFRVIACCDLDL